MEKSNYLRGFIKKFNFCIYYLTGFIIFFSSAYADNWSVKGQIHQDFYYDDNVIMRENPESSFVYDLTPTLSLSHKTQVSDITAFATYGVQKYIDIPEFDRTNQRYRINGSYLFDRASVGLQTSYSLTPTRNTASLDSGNFSVNSEKETFYISPNFAYQLSERDNFSIQGNYTDASYSTIEFNDYDTYGGNIAWERAWSERLTNTIDFFYSKFTSSSNEGGQLAANYDSYGSNISASYLYSETWTLNGAVGVRYTETEIEALNSKEDNVGFLMNFAIIYSGENLTGELSALRNLNPTAQGRLNEQTRFGLSLDYKLSERLNVSFKGFYQENESVNSIGGNNDWTNYSLSPAVKWKLTPELFVSASYRFRNQIRDIGSSEEDADSNQYMFTIGYRWKGLNISR